MAALPAASDIRTLAAGASLGRSTLTWTLCGARHTRSRTSRRKKEIKIRQGATLRFPHKK